MVTLSIPYIGVLLILRLPNGIWAQELFHGYYDPLSALGGQYHGEYADLEAEFRHLDHEYSHLQNLGVLNGGYLSHGQYHQPDHLQEYQPFEYSAFYPGGGYHSDHNSHPTSYVDIMLHPHGNQYAQPQMYYHGYGDSEGDVGQAKSSGSVEPIYHKKRPRPRKSYHRNTHKKTRKQYKPLRLPQKKKQKQKIISVDKGFYVPGGTQAFGKFKDIRGCMKACGHSPGCFAGDYNPWLGTCFFHSNTTACGTLRSHKKITHFKKVPCTVPDAPRGLVILGAQLHFAIEQKGIDELSTCIKKCAAVGSGIPATNAQIANQICFGIDYDFGSHKCYFHVRNVNPANRICGATTATLPTPRDLMANPSTVFIAMCPNV